MLHFSPHCSATPRGIGFSDMRKSSCVMCRSQHRKCSGTLPCERCMKLGISDKCKDAGKEIFYDRSEVHRGRSYSSDTSKEEYLGIKRKASIGPNNKALLQELHDTMLIASAFQTLFPCCRFRRSNVNVLQWNLRNLRFICKF